MFDRARVVDRIEHAIDHEPYCPVCGALTTVIEEDGILVLRCTAAIEPEGVIARLGAAILPHLRRRIIDLREGDLAA
jgi:hypothetical protein